MINTKSKHSSCRFTLEKPVQVSKTLNISCIYIIRNLNNNKVYIGQTKNYLSRFRGHEKSLSLNKHNNEHFQRSFCLGNSFRMEILEKCEEIYLDEKEIFWINYFDSTNTALGYNKATGGKGPRGWKHSEEWKKNMSKIIKGLNIVRDMSDRYKPVLSYSATTGEFIKEYESIASAALDLGIKTPSITRSLIKGDIAPKSRIFKYKTTDQYPSKIKISTFARGNLQKPIVQVDREGKVINTWTNKKDICDHLQMKWRNISQRFYRGYEIVKNDFKYIYI